MQKLIFVCIAMTNKLTLSILISILLYSCAREKTKTPTALTVHLNNEPNSLHPLNGTTGSSVSILSLTQKTLYQMDLRTLEMVPVLIKEMPSISEDGKEFTFTLKDGIKWDNGEELSSKDIVFSAKTAMCNFAENQHNRMQFRESIESIEIIDDKRFKFKSPQLNIGNKSIFKGLHILQQSYWDSLDVLTNVTFEEIHHHFFKNEAAVKTYFEGFNHEKNSNLPQNLVGLGQYQIVEWEKGYKLTLVKKNNWWGANDTLVYNKAEVDTIHYRIIDTEEATIAAIEKNEIDVSNHLGTKALVDLQKNADFNKNYYYDFVDQYGYLFIALNGKADSSSQNTALNDRKVRNALAKVIPVQELIDLTAYGHATRQSTNFCPSSPLYNSNLKPIDIDIEGANKLLSDAGWALNSDGIRTKSVNGIEQNLSIDLNYIGSSTSYEEMATIIKKACSEVGIIINLVGQEPNIMYPNVMSHKYEAAIISMEGSYGYNDPGQMWNSSSWYNNGLNLSGFGTPYTDSLIKASNTTINDIERKKALDLLQEEIYKEQPFIFLYQLQQKIIISKRIANPNFYKEKPSVIVNAYKIK